MRQKNSRPYSQAITIALILMSLTLWGCGSKPQKEQAEPKPPTAAKPQPVQEPGVTLTLPSSNYSTAFASAEQALGKFDWMQAGAVLQDIPAEGLSTNDATYMNYLQARIDYVRGDQQQALAQLAKLHGPNISPALRYRILSFEQYVLAMQGDTLASARLADQILRTAPKDTIAAWNRSIWRNLEETDKAQLAAALPGATDPQWRGWLELALLSREDSGNLTSQLSRWRDDHANHPAANPLPGGLNALLQSGLQRGKVALLLPLSGKLAEAGKAVLNGFLAAYYAERASGEATNELLVLDIDTFPSASGAYQEAVRQQASMVVGPLSKESLADLATLLERPIPILALNRIDQMLPASGSALVQLSLSPEDEAVSVAELAFGAGARRAVVISPAGEWGNKVETALRERWTSLGGTIASSATYSSYDDYSPAVKSTLSLDASEQRGRELGDVIGREVEFTPRRRQDVDIVFMLCHNGAEARSLKPLLAFHYAGELPIYAISAIYNGIPDDRNQDLNGVRLVETPWLLGANTELRVAIASGDVGGDYAQLNALGADAFLVQSGFSRLQSGADALFRGNTGLLSMDPNLRIQRKLSAATFDGSRLQAQ